jgi:lipoyl(octanoyl) transferase
MASALAPRPCATKSSNVSEPLIGVWLGRQGYAATYVLQLELFELIKRGQLGNVVLCLEHDPVITLGRGAHPEHLLADRATLAARGIDVESTDRGGDVTLHAPGQLVCYPLVRLAPDRCDVRRYVKDLIATMNELIAPSGLEAGELPGLIGLWVDTTSPSRWPGHELAKKPAKIGAIGVRLSRWVTMHGFALNLDPELSLFQYIVPCGISQFGVCSVARLTGSAPSSRALAPRACEILGRRLERPSHECLDASDVPLAELGRWLGGRWPARQLAAG